MTNIECPIFFVEVLYIGKDYKLLDSSAELKNTALPLIFRLQNFVPFKTTFLKNPHFMLSEQERSLN